MFHGRAPGRSKTGETVPSKGNLCCVSINREGPSASFQYSYGEERTHSKNKHGEGERLCFTTPIQVTSCVKTLPWTVSPSFELLWARPGKTCCALASSVPSTQHTEFCKFGNERPKPLTGNSEGVNFRKSFVNFLGGLAFLADFEECICMYVLLLSTVS
jgi:hypothetical protein